MVDVVGTKPDKALRACPGAFALLTMHAFVLVGAIALACPPATRAAEQSVAVMRDGSVAPTVVAQTGNIMDEMPGMQGEPGMDRASASSREASGQTDSMSGMQMSGMYGAYPMNREASGTSWQPDATPDEGIQVMTEGWMSMVHGYWDTVYDDQGGPRGAKKTFSESMLMMMSQHSLGRGTVGLRGMFSLDPTMGASGDPLLFASGETANGKDPLIDRQHPHNFAMELATSFSLPVSAKSSVYVYLALPGEPALGPPTFMHRFSGEDNPEAPISHHWFDSTHITEGVATLGYSVSDLKLEGSVFNGREPDEYRWGVEPRAFDSVSARLSWNPTQQLALQVSEGYLKSPEQLEPGISVVRRTASALYQSSLGEAPFGTTLAWGQNRRAPGADTAAWLLESTLKMSARYTLFGRAERLANDELFAPGDVLAHQVFKVSKLSLGAIDDFYKDHHVALGLGALVSRYAHAAELDPMYGEPTSYMLFLRAKIEP